MLTLDCIITADNNDDLMDAFEDIETALPFSEELDIYIDGVNRYWTGRRISGISASIFCAGLNTAEIMIAFACDDPTAKEIEGT
jgi:hypothetical protein